MTQLIRYQPGWLADLEREMDAMFGALPVAFWHRAGDGADRWVPACDVFSRDGDLVVQVDLPGIDPATDVRVTVEDGILCISGERHQDRASDGSYYRREWRYGAFERGIPLPEGASGEGITASYRDGVLEVVVPKAAKRAEPVRIPVTSTTQPKAVTTAQAAA
jgi:HSP20 family protein